MDHPADLLDRGIPDLVDTTDLPASMAAEVDHLAGRNERWANDADAPPALRARALAAIGMYGAAREALGECRNGELSDQALAASCWAVSRVGADDMLDRLEVELAKRPDGFLFEDDMPVGTTAMAAGLLAVARGRLDTALDELETAVHVGDGRAPVWGALARLERSRVLLTAAHLREGSDLQQQATRTLAASRAFFLAGAYRHLADVAKELEQPPDVTAGTEPLLGHLVSVDAPESADTGTAGWWDVGFGVQPAVRVRDRKGLHALGYLIANRHRRVPVIELEAVLEGRMAADITPVDEELLRSEVLLEEADLTDALRDLLLDDRARTRVSKLLRRTVAALADEHPVLAAHLDARVHTGYACRYEAAAALRWRFGEDVRPSAS